MGGLTMREKLIELLREVQYQGNAVHGYHDKYIQNGELADHLIAHGVTVQDVHDTNVGEWISVKDRLPEVATTHNTILDKSTDSIRVLCSCVQADGKKMVKEGYCKVYSDGYVHWKIPGTIHFVTHWQYLPQPPKGE
jgi:hypothetical protein